MYIYVHVYVFLSYIYSHALSGDAIQCACKGSLFSSL